MAGTFVLAEPKAEVESPAVPDNLFADLIPKDTAPPDNLFADLIPESGEESLFDKAKGVGALGIAAGLNAVQGATSIVSPALDALVNAAGGSADTKKLIGDAVEYWKAKAPDIVDVPNFSVYSDGKFQLKKEPSVPLKDIITETAGVGGFVAGPINVASKAATLATEATVKSARPFFKSIARGMVTGALVGEGDKEKTLENAALFGVFEGLASAAGKFSAARKIAKDTKWRMANIKERGLILQSIDDLIQKNPNMTEGEIIKRWNSDWIKKDALRRRSETEQKGSKPIRTETAKAETEVTKPTLVKAEPKAEQTDLPQITMDQTLPKEGRAGEGFVVKEPKKTKLRKAYPQGATYTTGKEQDVEVEYKPIGKASKGKEVIPFKLKHYAEKKKIDLTDKNPSNVYDVKPFKDGFVVQRRVVESEKTEVKSTEENLFADIIPSKTLKEKQIAKKVDEFAEEMNEAKRTGVVPPIKEPKEEYEARVAWHKGIIEEAKKSGDLKRLAEAKKSLKNLNKYFVPEEETIPAEVVPIKEKSKIDQPTGKSLAKEFDLKYLGETNGLEQFGMKVKKGDKEVETTISTEGVNRKQLQDVIKKTKEKFEGKEVSKSREDRFEALADAQRGKPESAMVAVQHKIGGGILNPVVENAGDLTHRMSQSPSFFKGGFEWVKPKVDSVHRYLNQEYGFEKEYKENIRNNAKAKGVSPEEYQKELDKALSKYADEHSKLETYNEAQTTARNLAIAIGKQNWNEARKLVAKLKEHTDQGEKHWQEYALEDTIETPTNNTEISSKETVKLEEKLKTSEKNFKSIFDPLLNEEGSVSVGIPAKDLYNEFKKSIGRTAKLADYYLGALSTRAENIDPSIKNLLIEYELDSSTKIEDIIKHVLPLIKATKKMSKEDYKTFDLARKNSDTETINKILDKYEDIGLKKHYKHWRLLDDALIEQARNAGFKVNYLKEHNPREVRDFEGLMDHLHKTGKLTTVDLFIRQKEKRLGRPMTRNEKIELVNSIFRGYADERITLSKPGQLKIRKLRKITPELDKFFGDSNSAMLRYISDVVSAIEARKIFGKGVNKDSNIYNLDNTFGAYILDLSKKKRLTPSQELELRSILKARFNPAGTKGIVTTFKNLAVIDVMGSPASALRQVGDIGWALIESGMVASGKVLPRAVLAKSRFTRESLGISKIGAEFSDKTKSAKAVDAVFKAVGLTRIDSIGKEILINSAYNLAVKKAKSTNPKVVEEFRKSLEPVFGNRTEALIEDFKNERDTRDARLFMLRKLSEYQPATMSDLPQGFIEGGNARIFYMLKSFDLKKFDVYRRKVFRQIATKGKRVKGIRNLFKIAFFLTIAEATADMLIDLFLGRPVDFSDVFLARLSQILVSRYTTMRMKREGVLKPLLEQAVPPTQLIDSLSKDIINAGDDKGLLSTKSIPVVGKWYYYRFGRGSKKIEKEKAKSENAIRRVQVKRVGAKRAKVSRNAIRARRVRPSQ